MDFDTPSVLWAFSLTLFAGLATGIGSLIAFLARRTNTGFLSLALGFSAGVMIYVSFVEIFVKARKVLMEANGEVAGTWATVGAFFGGMALIFTYSFLSGITEPVGAFVGYLLLMPFFTPTLFGVLFASVAGIMVFISFDQLLPAAEEFGEHHLAIYGLIAGMAVMALSLLLFL